MEPHSRPAVDIVIPFAGSTEDLSELVGRLGGIVLRGCDSILVVDNRPSRAPPVALSGTVRIVRAPAIRSSYHARNRAVSVGDAPWLLFVDADVEWCAGLPDAYFAPPPRDATAVLAGTVVDAPLTRSGGRPTLAERYAVTNRTMASTTTLDSTDRAPYAQTANCMIRRSAFEAVGGFADDVRSGGDADLCFRLQAAGWEIERRPDAGVVHRNRRALVALLAQKLRHGSGAAWLERQHRGTFPRRRLPGLVAWSVRQALLGARPAEGAPLPRRLGIIDVLAVWAFELGRMLPNRVRRGPG